MKLEYASRIKVVKPVRGWRILSFAAMCVLVIWMLCATTVAVVGFLQMAF